MFAKIVVDLKNDCLNESYDYIIPDELLEFVNIGSRVLVSFGFQDVLGYVVAICETSAIETNIKPIKEVLDFERELTEEQIEVAKYLSEYYQVDMASALELMIPSFLKGKKRNYLIIKNYNSLHPELAQAFLGKTKIKIDSKILEFKSLIKKEQAKGNIMIEYDIFSYGQNKKKKLYYLANNLVQKTKKRESIRLYLLENPDSSEEMIYAYCDAGVFTLKNMIKEGIVKVKEVSNIEVKNQNKINYCAYKFTFNQLQTMERFDKARNGPFLLFAGNEEFKLPFIVHIIEKNQQKNLKTLIVAPTIFSEISLYHQICPFLNGYEILSLNSKLSRAEEYDAYMNVKYQNFDVLITTMNGIFAPYKNIGTIIVLEAESSYYITDNYPYYDTIDILEYRAHKENIKLLLISASPAINHFYKAETGQYNYIIDESVNQPNVSLINMRTANHDDLILSDFLITQMSNVLSKQKQVMLVIDNLGYASFMQCRNCQKVLKCPNCDIALKLFSDKKIAKCPYCDYKTINYLKCSCGHENIQTFGYGVERVIKSVQELFPEQKIIQVDSTTLKNHDDYVKAFSQIEDQEANIIIGTNILTTYLENTNIELIALLSADKLLNLADYRAFEYTYNSIAKMINRKQVIIQSYYSDNDIIRDASINNYENYYQNEIKRRQLLQYPPFLEVNRLVITGGFNEIYHFANYFKKIYKNIIKGTILGPTYDGKEKGLKLILKHQDIERLYKILEETKKHFENQGVLVRFERKPRRL